MADVIPRQLLVLALAGALAGCADPPPAPSIAAARSAAASLPASGARSVVVMTRNLYLGTDIFQILAPSPDPIPLRVARMWGEIQATNFPERAGAIADEVAAAMPQLIGLQEAPLYRFDPLGDAAVGGTHPATVVGLDFLQTLRDSLAARGLEYDVASVDTLTDVELPMLASLSPVTLVDIRYTDRDVVLVRHGVATTDPRHGVYAARIPISIGGTTVGYQVRGWSSVAATVGGVTYRFATTHLETEGAPPIQVAQATELVGVLAGETRPTILVGDFNSAGDRSETASYGLVVDQGHFLDAWLEANPRDPGYTVDFPGDLLGPANLHKRIDFVFVRQGVKAAAAAGIVGGVQADVVGDQESDRTPVHHLWPSDHAGVVARLQMPAALGRP